VPADARKRRLDAAQNREAILAVALAALTESSEVSLNAIAKRAGVANATLYRHFPTRESLVLEVYRHEVRHVVSAADQLLDDREPGAALREWVARLAQYAMTKHGLADAMRAAASPGSALFEETYVPIVSALGRLLAAAEEAGLVRAGLDPDDVILALAGLWEIDPSTDWKARASRLYDLVFTGLRALGAYVAVMTGRGEDGAGSATADGRRREEVLDTAAKLFASSGLRTSVQDIADACGIKPGSLYHHFESKEAIVVALLRRYHAELDRTAEIGLEQLRVLDGPPLEQVMRLGTAIAQCAVRHSAAVQFTFYEPPASAGQELTDLASRAPGAIEAAMLATLRVGQGSGSIRAGLDLEVLADRICQTMLHVSLGLFHRYTAVHRVAGLLCGMMLHGVSASASQDAELDQSAALLAVEQVIRHWDDSDTEPTDERVSLVRRAARTEFGRRGYEVTTVRDIAAAAGLSTGTTYRLIGSKEALLDAIMSAFYVKVMAGWDAALGSASTAVEKLDALAWLQINVLDKFKDEYKIQLAWMRELPPDADLPWSFSVAVRQLKTLLGQGSRLGQLRVDSPSSELTARCVIELTWMPEGIVRDQGKRAALGCARDTLVRGVAVR